MPTILQPPATRPLAAITAQTLRLVADASTNWWARTNGGSWSKIGTSQTELFWTTSSSVSRRQTFDEVQIFVSTSSPSSGETGGLHLNLCEGPVAGLFVTGSMRDPAREEPGMHPDAGESDDPPLGLVLGMPGASRDGFGSVRTEDAAGVAGGPANLCSWYGPGLFVDTAGKLGARTWIAVTHGVTCDAPPS